MRPIHLFYSWQSDRDRKVCGRFIRLAIEAAIESLEAQHSIAIRLDSDTADVPGTPPVSETILAKIRECEIFVGDVTFVGKAENGKLLPNPNVMIEFGYARGVLTDHQILSVMNTAYGSPKELPFDLAHLRHPTAYSVDETASDDERRRSRALFTEKLVPRLKAIAEAVLARRAASKPQEEVIGPAQAVVASIIQMNGRAELPVIVAGPKPTMQLVTSVAAGGVIVPPSSVTAVRSSFVPAGYRDEISDTNVREWSSFDPPRVIQGKPNPEARWYMRALRNGALDAATMVGARIDDDRDILVELIPLEARIVEMAERMAAIAQSIGADSPLVVHASLEGLDDVRLMAQHKATRPLRMPFIDLGSIAFSSSSAVTISGLRPILDNVWLAGGFSNGSPLFEKEMSETDRRDLLAEPEVIRGRAWRS